MSTTAAVVAPETPARGWNLPAVATVVLGAAFFLTMHNLFISRLEMYGTTEEDLEAKALGGKLTNQVGFTLVAVLGLAFLARRGGRPWQVRGVLPAAILLFAAWAAASYLWSADPAKTVKRVGILTMCMVGAVGVARQLTARDLCRLALGICGAYAVLGLATELVLGTFRPGGADYRFAGSLHPNGQGANCAMVCLTSCCLLTERPRSWPLLLGILVLGGGLLVLTGSRTAAVGLVAGLLVLGCLRPSRVLVLGALAAAWLLCGAALAAGLAGRGETGLADMVLLGRAEHATTLTGRTELWEELLPYARQRLWLGYGYGSFWSPERIEEVSETLYWGLSTAHSTYLEILLGAGLVGLALLLTFGAAGLWRAAGAWRASGGAGAAYVLAMLVYGLATGVAESDFLAPSFEGFLAGAGLAQLAFFRREAGPPGEDHGRR